MTPLRLTLHNFMSYLEPPTLDFAQFDLAVLSGDNGAGKSTLLEALTWAVWEKTRAGSSDDLIHQGTGGMWVDFAFEHEKQIYRIFRRRDKKKQGGSTLEFYIKDKTQKNLLADHAWQSLTEGTLRQTQEKVIETLKIPYEIFVNSSYLRQGKADEFTAKTPAERKVVLAEILGLSEWDTLEAKAKEKHKNLSNETKVLAMQLETLKENLADKNEVTKNLKQAEKEKTKLKQALEKLEIDFRKVEAIKNQKEILEEKVVNLRQRWQEIADEMKAIEQEIKDSQAEQQEWQEALKNKHKIEADYAAWQAIQKNLTAMEAKLDEYQKLKNELNKIIYKKEDLDDKVAKLKKIEQCPTCLRDLKKTEADSIIKKLMAEFLAQTAKEKKAIEANVKKLDYSEDLHQKMKDERRRLEGVETQYRELKIASSSWENSQKNQKKLADKKEARKIALDKIVADGKILDEKIQKLPDIEEKWQNLRDEIEAHQSGLMSAESNLGALLQALKEIESQEKKAAELEAKLIQNQTEAQVFEELALAFSKKGIQAMVIEQAIPMIEEEANRILAKASDGRLSLRFLTQRAKKTGEELIETLDIKISDEAGERDYEMYSGGEAFRINFAVRVALSKFLASRSGVHLKFLCVDEGFGTLDVSGREDLVGAINAIRPDFAKILVVTHIQEFKDLFPAQILVTKTAKGSQWELTG